VPGFLTVLPLAFVMVAGPQIISAVFLATSENWRKNSAAFLAGVLLAVTFFVTLAYFVVRGLKSAAGASHKHTSGRVIDVVIVLLLLVAAAYVFRGRKDSEPPKWMGRLETATPKFAFTLGVLLLGVFPTDLVTSFSVGSYLTRHNNPWWHCLPFVFVTVFLEALPVLLVILLGKRAAALLPKVRDWMSANSWIISELVIALFVAIEINNLVSS
jgi:hypothetical protein